ncbi:MAG: desulfoferrodoxin, partial [Oscillospiraceae bacterium]|nr:desulfoferrodoxin [Oscillospiraceae bacterium]
MAKFYICRHCGNLIGMIHNAGVPMMCCGQKMDALEPGTVEASAEKHIPAVTLEGDVLKVNVGSIDHPMLPEHYIEWVYVET